MTRKIVERCLQTGRSFVLMLTRVFALPYDLAPALTVDSGLARASKVTLSSRPLSHKKKRAVGHPPYPKWRVAGSCHLVSTVELN